MSRSAIHKENQTKVQMRRLVGRYSKALLHEVVAAGDADGLHALLAMELNSAIDAPNHEGLSALCVAVERRDDACVGLLLGHGADPDQMIHVAEGGAVIPLIHIAILAASHNIVALMLASGAKTTHHDSDKSALLVAVENKQWQCVQLLLEHQADPRLGAGRRSPLAMAAYVGCYRSMKLLIHHGASSDQGHLNVSLWLAVLKNNIRCVKLLVDQSAGLNCRVEDVPDLQAWGELGDDLILWSEMTPIMCAAERGHHRILTYFLEQPEWDANARCNEFNDLWFSVFKGNRVCAQALMDCGVDADVSHQLGTPLTIAVWRGDEEIASALIAHGANVNLPMLRGGTPLHVAVASKKVRMMELLLQHGASVNALDQRGLTPLDHALLSKQVAIMARLVAVEGVSLRQLNFLLEGRARDRDIFSSLLAAQRYHAAVYAAMFAALMQLAEASQYAPHVIQSLRTLIATAPSLGFGVGALIKGSCADRIVEELAANKAALVALIAMNEPALDAALNQPTSCLGRVFRRNNRWCCFAVNYQKYMQVALVNLRQRPRLLSAISDVGGAEETKGDDSLSEPLLAALPSR